MKEEERNKIIAKAWKDPEFKKRLLSKPQKAFEEVGCTFPKNTNVKVIEDTSSTFTFVLPPPPSKVKELLEEELTMRGGGTECQMFPCPTMGA
jgi:hypothetical protein